MATQSSREYYTASYELGWPRDTPYSAKEGYVHRFAIQYSYILWYTIRQTHLICCVQNRFVSRKSVPLKAIVSYFNPHIKLVPLFGILPVSTRHSDVHITVYPKKNAHGFCFAVLCCGYTLTDFPISIRLTSLALWQSNDCPSASKATLMNMDKYFMWIHYERLHNHNKAKHNKTVCIFLGIYCTRDASFFLRQLAGSILAIAQPIRNWNQYFEQFMFTCLTLFWENCNIWQRDDTCRMWYYCPCHICSNMLESNYQ